MCATPSLGSMLRWRLGSRADNAGEQNRPLWVALREHQQVEHLRTVGRQPELQTVRSELESRLRRLLFEMEGYVGAADEGRLLGELERQVGRYLTASEGLRVHGTSPELAMQTLRPHFERAIATSAEFGRQNEANRQASRATAARALRVQSIVAGSSALLLLLGFGVVAVRIRRLILRPILNLQGAVQRFRAGDAGDKASGSAIS